MIARDLVFSEDLRNRLMDVIKCTNDEYSRLIKDIPKIAAAPKDELRDCEFFIRRSLYSVFLDMFGLENEVGAKDAYTDYVGSFTERLSALIEPLELNDAGKRTIAACLAICVAAAAEDARDMRTQW